MRKQIITIVALLCVALSGYAQMVVKGKTGGVLYEINMVQQKATVLGAVGSPTELTIPVSLAQFQVTEFAMNPGAVGSTMSMAATISAIADGAFAACSALTSVTMESATPLTLNGTFASTFPAGVTIYVPSASAKTAYEGAGWQNVQLEGGSATNPTGNCGANGDNLTWAFVDGTLVITGSGAMADFDFDYGTYSPNTPWKQYRFQITALDLPEGMTYVGQFAFWGLDGLKDVVLPEGLVEIADYAFSSCQGLKSITFPSTLETIGASFFANNYALREITANGLVPPAWNGNKPNQNAAIIDVYVQEGYIETYEVAWGTTYYTFHNPKDMCGPNLRWKYETDTHALTIYRFEESKPATMYSFVNISDNPDFFTTPDAPWYQYHDEMTSISLPEGLTNIGSMAFYGCSTVVEAPVIPSSVTDIEASAFAYCYALRGIVLPDGLQYLGEKAFLSCSSLDTINIPAGISTIRESTFEYCSSLPYLYLPATVQAIERNAFNECTNLVRIDVEGATPATIAMDINVAGAMGALSNGQRVFCRDYSEGYTDIEVYIPSGTKAAYEAAWGTETAVDVLGTHQVQCRLNYHDPADSGATGMEDIMPSGDCVRKVLKNGQIMILRGGRIYSIDGKNIINIIN